MQLFFFNDTATTEIYTLSLHDALPIWVPWARIAFPHARASVCVPRAITTVTALVLGCASTCSTSASAPGASRSARSEEHTSELQSRQYLVCRLLLEKKNTNHTSSLTSI